MNQTGMDQAGGPDGGTPPEPREAQRSVTEIIVAAVAGAVANPVVADAYAGVKAAGKAGLEKLRGPGAEGVKEGEAQEPPETGPAE